MFGRKKARGGVDAGADSAMDTSPDLDAPSAEDLPGSADGDVDTRSHEDMGSGATSGPRDLSEVGEEDSAERIDLGSLQVTPVPDMELRLELDEQREVTAAVISVDDSLVQLQTYAAPRSSGIWEDIRTEIEATITGSGGTVERQRGPFGTEMRTRLPQSGPEGRTVFAPAVFAGIDGPRWFVRAVYSGPAAIDPERRAVLDEAVRGLVVVRGDEPRAPREMLPLRLPKGQDAATAPPGNTAEEASGDDLAPFERGPEITETR